MATEFSQNEEQKNAQYNINGDGQTPENLSVAEAIERLFEIVKKNEHYMAQAFANAPEWQSRAQMTMTTFKDGEKQKNSHVVINVPSTFSKEQKEILKEYVTQMGGTYTNMKVVETGLDGNQSISFPAKIEFGKDAAYTPEICAKMLLGEGKDNLIKEILETNAAYNQKRQITQDKEKKMSNSNDNQKIAFGKKGGPKL